MDRPQELNVTILNQQGIAYQGTCRALLVPTHKETLAVLPYHTPLILILSHGPVAVITKSGKKVVGQIDHGILYVGQNEASVLMNA